MRGVDGLVFDDNLLFYLEKVGAYVLIDFALVDDEFHAPSVEDLDFHDFHD